jgi:virginiamycin B lyase
MPSSSFVGVAALWSSVVLGSLTACSGGNVASVPPQTTGALGFSRTPEVRGKFAFFDDTFGDATPAGIVAGPDGALWFTDPGNDVVGRITTHGTYTIQQTTDSEVNSGITVGSDGNLWFTLALQGGGLGSITTAGVVTLYADPGGSYTQYITTAADGTLWFTESNGSVGHRLKNGKIQHFTVGPSDAILNGIVQGPDGNFWIAETQTRSRLADKVFRMSASGKTRGFKVGIGPNIICVGPDKALWFTELGSGVIGRLTTAGKYTEFPIEGSSTAAFGIAAGPDNALWFTDEINGGGISRITTDGKITFYTTGSHFTSLANIALGPDGAMWFTSPLDPEGIGRLRVR